MRENHIVGLELAKLARAKGFNEVCDYAYCYDNDKQAHYLGLDLEYYRNSMLWEKHFSAPSRDQLQKWLRDRNIIVTIELDRTYEPKYVYSVDVYKDGGNWDKEYNQYSDLYYTYEQAFEEGLIAGLKKL